MGMVTLRAEVKGATHEVELHFREDQNMMGQWLSEDWEAVMARAVASVKASIKSAGGE